MDKATRQANVVDMASRRGYITPESNALSSGTGVSQFGGGGGRGPMEPTVPLKDYVDAQDNAIESRLAQQLDKLPTKSTIWTAMATALGIGVALAAFGADRFDGGVSASSLLDEGRAQQAKTDEAQDAKLELMDQKLDLLIKQTAEK